MDTKYYLHSKQFWGMVASLVGFVAIIVSSFFGHDIQVYVTQIGAILQVFGIPFTFYGAFGEPQLTTTKPTTLVPPAPPTP